MNIDLLRRKDRTEWDLCFGRLWTCAISAAEHFLFRNAYSDHDREEIASNVIREFQKTLCRGGIPGCGNEEDASRWIWGRTQWRARDLRRRRERENDLFVREEPTDQQAADAEVPDELVARVAVHQPAVREETRLNELIAWARLLPAGFSRNEEAAYRAIEIMGLTTEEYAERIGRAPGTVGRWAWNAKLKLAAVLELELKMFL